MRKWTKRRTRTRTTRTTTTTTTTQVIPWSLADDKNVNMKKRNCFPSNLIIFSSKYFDVKIFGCLGIWTWTCRSPVWHSTNWAKQTLFLRCLKIIYLFQKSRRRPWTSIGRHLFGSLVLVATCKPFALNLICGLRKIKMNTKFVVTVISPHV